jgi:hypothetical protein
MAAKKVLIGAALILSLAAASLRGAGVVEGVALTGIVMINAPSQPERLPLRASLHRGSDTPIITDFEWVPGVQFKLQDVPPGSYRLKVMGRSEVSYEGSLEVVVGEKDISGIIVVLRVPSR